MNPTIKDVAQRAGVSLSTVSLVLNRKKNVSEETAKRVQQAIKELDYHPQRSAQGLASKKSGNIGFILTSDHFSRAEPFYTKIFLGSEFEARKHNYYILLTTVEQDFHRKCIPRFLLERNVDGVILAGRVPDGLISYVEQMDLPLIFIDYFPANGNYPAVLIDNTFGAKQAVKHLIDKGHRQIAFIGGDISHPSIQDRFLGYKQALEEASIPFNENLAVVDEDYPGDKNGYSAMCKLRKRKASFTAVFAANDAMAFGCMKCLKEKGIRVPDQVALVGFDDVDVSWQMDPQLTTIRVNKEDMGALAVKNLVDLISSHKKSLGKILVPVELVVRNSS
ncbi:MAG: LacI family transcriptional regulator [candidate division KSB1 bacterium]|nr:LacI family transcriptional regulator [candidate division KSB1 bacterium]